MMMESWSFNSLWRRNNMQISTLVIAVSIIAAALPVKSSPQVAAYDSSYYPPPPAPEVYNPPQPIYYVPAPVNYVPTPQYPPPYYSQPQYYPEKSVYQVEKLNYDAVTYRELNVSAKCGVSVAVNEQLVKDAYNKKNVNSPHQYGTALFEMDDVSPFGVCPWRVRITDEYNNYLCQATIIQNRQLLTHVSCIQGRSLESLRFRHGDWDLLNDVNEHEAYKNYETRVCRTLPVPCPSTYGYSDSDSVGQLVLLQVDFIQDYDKYPQIKPICLPEWPTNPPPYSPPTYYQEPKVDVQCWVEGYYASPTIELQNHNPPQPLSDNYYSVPAKDYNPYAPNYYPEKSKLPRHAQLKRVEQYQQPPQYGYKTGAAQCDEEEQWVGVNGFDACVADVGAAIVCSVPEDETYESGYQSNEAPYGGQTQYQQPPQYETYPPYKEIKAAPSPDKESPRRYIIVGVVKSTTDCTNYEEKSQYDPRVPQENAYERQQSRPITVVKVNRGVVNNILDKFWQGALDESCPAPKSSYPEPNYYPETMKPQVYQPDPSPYAVSPYPAPAPIYSRPPQY